MKIKQKPNFACGGFITAEYPGWLARLARKPVRLAGKAPSVVLRTFHFFRERVAGMNQTKAEVDRIKIGLAIAMLTTLTGCFWGGGGYGNGGYIGGGYVGGGYGRGGYAGGDYVRGGWGGGDGGWAGGGRGNDRGREVSDFSARGVQSRGAAHGGGGSNASGGHTNGGHSGNKR